MILPQPSIARWVTRFIDECAAAGCGGKHDDAADMLSQAINKFRKTYGRGWLTEGAKLHKESQNQGPKTSRELADAQKRDYVRKGGSSIFDEGRGSHSQESPKAPLKAISCGHSG